jgi:excisionase family DNA binding protein
MERTRKSGTEGPLLDLLALEERSTVSRHTWRLWARQGRIASVRLGRRLLFREKDFLDFVEANRRGARS